MRKAIVFIVLILCFMCNVLAINSGENFKVTNIERCYGIVDIKIWGIVNTSNDGFSFSGCEKVGYDRWKCNCIEDNNTPIILETKNYTNNIYDVVVQYYIAPGIKYDYNRRTTNVNNIRVGPKPIEETKFTFKLPDINIAGVFIVAVIMLIVSLILVTYYIWKHIINDKEEEQNTGMGYFIKKRHKPKELKTGDNDIDNIIKNM